MFQRSLYKLFLGYTCVRSFFHYTKYAIGTICSEQAQENKQTKAPRFFIVALAQCQCT